MPRWVWRPPRLGRTAVYRLFNLAGELLYVGVSNDPAVRYRQHQKDQPWGDEIASRVVEWFDTRAEALRAEPMAIRLESPKYNIAYSTSGRVSTASAIAQVAPDVKPDLAIVEATLRGVIAKYQIDLARALEARNEGIRRVAAKGLRQVDVMRVTGYSRETVRQALNPEIRAAMKKAAGERRARKDAK